jgi:hypothetical protein
MFKAAFTPLVAGCRGEYCADGEADCSVPAKRDAENSEQNNTNHADREVLAIHVGVCAFLNG